MAAATTNMATSKQTPILPAWGNQNNIAKNLATSNLNNQRDYIESKMGYVAVNMNRLKKANESFDAAQTRVLKDVSKQLQAQLKSKIQSIYFDHQIQAVHYTTKHPEHIKTFENFDVLIQNNKYKTIPKKTPYLLITIDIYDNVLDQEIIVALSKYGKVIGNILHCTHSFDNTIYNGKRKIQLQPSVKVEEIPYFLKFNGINTQLFFKGKAFKCKKCSIKHKLNEPCPDTELDEPQEEKITLVNDAPKEQLVKDTDTTPFTVEHTPKLDIDTTINFSKEKFVNFNDDGAVIDDDMHCDDQPEIFRPSKPVEKHDACTDSKRRFQYKTATFQEHHKERQKEEDMQNAKIKRAYEIQKARNIPAEQGIGEFEAIEFVSSVTPSESEKEKEDYPPLDATKKKKEKNKKKKSEQDKVSLSE